TSGVGELSGVGVGVPVVLPPGMSPAMYAPPNPNAPIMKRATTPIPARTSGEKNPFFCCDSTPILDPVSHFWNAVLAISSPPWVVDIRDGVSPPTALYATVAAGLGIRSDSDIRSATTCCGRPSHTTSLVQSGNPSAETRR